LPASTLQRFNEFNQYELTLWVAVIVFPWQLVAINAYKPVPLVQMPIQFKAVEPTSRP
jgi:hypothetical protein